VTSTIKSASDGSNRLLAALLPVDFSLLARDLADYPLEPGVLLQEVGLPIEWVYFPEEGMISLLALMRNGSAVETATVGREGAVGAMAGLGSRNASSRAVVQLQGKGLRISSWRLAAAVNQSTGLKDLLVRYNDALLAMINQSAGCNALHQVEGRLCRWLLQTRDRSDSDIIPLTQEFLSQMLGVRRTTVTLVARELQARGVIEYRRGRIRILDRGGLEECACECYTTVRRWTDEVFSNGE
jgi:CRP-like cAMP-binding protein